jgi:hypothetical protein
MFNTITNNNITQTLLKIFAMKILCNYLALVNINFIVHSTNLHFQDLHGTQVCHIDRIVTG